MRAVATAGHVDHGKSSLVRALTGTDPDRFAEEKTRGLTIDLGFAFTTLPSGVEVGFVDVPGHVRFLKNMLAGVGAVEVVLFVVSAREGWMPQSEEHLTILELLGIDRGVVAVTNADRVDEATLEAVGRAVTARLRHSVLRDAALVPCDSVSGRGLASVRAALDAVLAASPEPRDVGRPRLWVDRVFAPRGAGTVVTGTLTGGRLAVDDPLEVAGRDESTVPVRVRGIETAKRRVEVVAPGARVALNLSGVERGDVGRGDAVVVPKQWVHTSRVEGALTIVAGQRFRDRVTVHAYVGSGEHLAVLRVLDPGRRFACLRLPRSLPLAPGDRVVLRDPGRGLTVAGLEILDVDPPDQTRDAAARLALPPGPRLLAATGRIPVGDVGRRTGLSATDAEALTAALVDDGLAVRVGDELLVPSLLERTRSGAWAVVEREGPVPFASLASRLGTTTNELRAALDLDLRLLVEHGTVRDASTGRATESSAARALVASFDASPFTPPQPDDPALARALVRSGVLVDVGGTFFTATAVERARALLRERLAATGQLTVGDARDLLASSRKYVVPLLEHFDREGFTRRRGDVRVAGPTAQL